MRCMTRIRLRIPKMPVSLTGWILVDECGLPRYWATVWATILKPDLKDETRGRHLAGIEKLYRSVIVQTGEDCLDRLIAEMDFDSLEAALGGFLTTLNNQSSQDSVNREREWASAVMFLDEVLRYSSRHTHRRSAELHAGMHRLKQLYAQLRPARPASPAPIRALPAVVIEDLYRLFDPNSGDNPFRTSALRNRNFLMFLLLLHLGLRRGEAAILSADAIKDGFDPASGDIRFWLDVVSPEQFDDPRHEKPSLKTQTSRRQLPITREIVSAFDHVIQNYRCGMNHSYLFCSQQGKPLALRSMNRIFETATKHLSQQARKALADRGRDKVTPHDLRHTCAVYRLSSYLSHGYEMDAALNKLRVFFGWSHHSEMPRYYARAYFETTAAEVWNDDYDSFVSALRSLEGMRP